MNKNTIIAIGIGVLVLAAAGYIIFGRSTPTAGVSATAPASPAELTFVNLASQLEPLGFDTSILSDSRFLSLTDIHTAIIPETPGRRDPFGPLGK